MHYQIQFIWFCVHCLVQWMLKQAVTQRQRKQHSEIRSKHPACHKKLEEPSLWRSCHQRLIGSLLLWVLVIGFQKTQVFIALAQAVLQTFQRPRLYNYSQLWLIISEWPNKKGCLSIQHVLFILAITYNLHFIHNISYFVYFCSSLKKNSKRSHSSII